MIRVSDLDATLGFFQDKLGLDEAEHVAFARPLDNISVELLEQGDKPTDP